MRYLMLLAVMACLALAVPVSAEDKPTARLTVEVAGMRVDKGQLRLGIFDKAKGYPDKREAAVGWHSLPAKPEGDAEACTFGLDLPPGKYAIIVLHDENENEKLDTGFMGKPEESIGYSNNPRPMFRAAKFSEAAFELPQEGKQIRIELQHP
jgi:uncharacterized protein (DUF2141 family)